jgi:hypothetical protein
MVFVLIQAGPGLKDKKDVHATSGDLMWGCFEGREKSGY